MSSMQRNKESKRKIWGRYQGLMLVGDQGQVIPFRRFKIMATVVVIGLIISLIVIAVLGILLAGSRVKFNSLKGRLDQAQIQLTKLRDEKDLLLTQMVIKKKQDSSPAPVLEKKPPADTAVQKNETAADKVLEARPEKPAQAEKAAAPVEPEKPAVKLSADARRIKVSYQAERQLLSLSFRIYNTSKPKAPLAGRTVVVFKNQDDPPIKWLVVPRVQLVDNKPSGKKGKAFRINNYRTEKFNAYRQKAPVRYNMATIFIFSSTGELLLSKDHSFKIDVKPTPKPVIPAPKPPQKKIQPAPMPTKPIKPPAQSTPRPPAVETNDAVTDSSAAPDDGTLISPPPASPAPSPVTPPTEVPPGTQNPATPGSPETTTEPETLQPQNEQTPQPTTQGEKP